MSAAAGHGTSHEPRRRRQSELAEPKGCLLSQTLWQLVWGRLRAARVEFLTSCVAPQRERERVRECVRERSLPAFVGVCGEFRLLRIGESLLNVAAATRCLCRCCCYQCSCLAGDALSTCCPVCLTNAAPSRRNCVQISGPSWTNMSLHST